MTDFNIMQGSPGSVRFGYGLCMDGGGQTPPFGPFLCTSCRNQNIRKSEDQKWSLRNDFHAGTTPLQITEVGSLKNSFFEGPAVICISVTRATSGTNRRNVSAQEFPKNLRNLPWQHCSGEPKVGDHWGHPMHGTVQALLITGSLLRFVTLLTS